MRRVWPRWTASALLAISAGWCAAGDKTISGSVMDAKGQPAAGVEIAVGWNCDAKAKRLEPAQKIKTDRTGRFSGSVPCEEGPVAIMALDKDRGSGAIKVVPIGDLTKSIKLQMSPLVNIAGELAIGEFSTAPKSYSIELQAQPETVGIIKFDTDSTKLKLSLPVGSYRMLVTAKDAEDAETEFELSADEPQFDIGKLALEPKAGKTAGKGTPFFKITDAIGVSKDMKLSDYKGKWVLIDFWGYW